jgi:hypothetical protein
VFAIHGVVHLWPNMCAACPKIPCCPRQPTACHHQITNQNHNPAWLPPVASSRTPRPLPPSCQDMLTKKTISPCGGSGAHVGLQMEPYLPAAPMLTLECTGIPTSCCLGFSQRSSRTAVYGNVSVGCKSLEAYGTGLRNQRHHRLSSLPRAKGKCCTPRQPQAAGPSQ